MTDTQQLRFVIRAWVLATPIRTSLLPIATEAKLYFEAGQLTPLPICGSLLLLLVPLRNLLARNPRLLIRLIRQAQVAGPILGGFAVLSAPALTESGIAGARGLFGLGARAATAAYLGATAAVALTYFEFSPDWVVVVWSVLVVVLVLTAWLLDRRIFLAQALTLLVAVAARAVLLNLFSAPLVAGSFWSSGLICVGSACAVVLLALPIGFRLRKMPSDSTPPGDVAGCFFHR